VYLASQRVGRPKETADLDVVHYLDVVSLMGLCGIFKLGQPKFLSTVSFSPYGLVPLEIYNYYVICFVCVFVMGSECE